MGKSSTKGGIITRAIAVPGNKNETTRLNTRLLSKYFLLIPVSESGRFFTRLLYAIGTSMPRINIEIGNHILAIGKELRVA